MRLLEIPADLAIAAADAQAASLRARSEAALRFAIEIRRSLLVGEPATAAPARATQSPRMGDLRLITSASPR